MTNLPLELSTEEVDHPVFTVDGIAYELKIPDDFSIVEIRRIVKLQKIIDGMDQIDKPSERQSEEYENALTEFVRMVAPTLPKEIIERKNWRTSKQAIIISFFLNAPKSNPLLAQISPSLLPKS